MEASQEYRKSIENIVKNNPRFSGNEDLLEDFCSETFKRSYSIISTLSNIDKVEGYLNKVSTSAILDVLKKSGRLRQSKEGYSKIQQVHIDPVGIYEIDEDGNIKIDIADPRESIEETILQKDQLDKIKELIQVVDREHCDKNFLNIFIMRYVKGLKQSEIAKIMDISQGEVSKRLVELTKQISHLLETQD